MAGGLGGLFGPRRPRPLTPRDLGTPLRQRLTLSGAVWAEGGGWVLGVVASGTPARWVEFRLGEAGPSGPRRQVPLPGVEGAWACARHPSGTVYLAGHDGGRVLAVPPGADRAEDLGVPVAGDSTLFAFALDPDGERLA